ncbi:MAG: class I SAM-dependent methyltransferase [Prosthecobacter sp.]
MSFDLLAPHYRWMEWLSAGELQRCRTALLDAISAPTKVLIYGEGDGRFLMEFCSRFPLANITVVDASMAMITLAKKRLAQAGMGAAPVEFIHADALTWKPPAGEFDLLVTCFFLDCFREDELRRLVPVIAAAARSSARWLVADFQIPASGLARVRARVILAVLYAFFRRATALSAHELVDPAQMLRAEGFGPEQRVEHDHGLLYSEVWRQTGPKPGVPRA